MVKINNQRKAFLDMLAWSEGIDNGRQKPEIMVMTSSGERLFTDYSDRSPQTCHAKPKTQINRAPDATSFFPVGRMPTASSLA